MNSPKCPSCGLVNFADALNCKRCDSVLPKKGDPRATTCPTCKSGDTQSFQMAYQTGTTTGLLVGASEGGGIGVAGGRSQSVLAKTVAPPKQGSVGESFALIALLIIGFNVVGVVLMAVLDSFLALILSIALTIAVAIFGLVRSNSTKEQKQRAFEAAMRQWAHSWICLRCGKSWVIS